MEVETIECPRCSFKCTGVLSMVEHLEDKHDIPAGCVMIESDGTVTIMDEEYGDEYLELDRENDLIQGNNWHDIQLNQEAFELILDDIDEEYSTDLRYWGEQHSICGISGEFELDMIKQILSCNYDIPYAKEMGEYWEEYIRNYTKIQLGIEPSTSNNPHLNFLSKLEDGWERLQLW